MYLLSISKGRDVQYVAGVNWDASLEVGGRSGYIGVTNVSLACLVCRRFNFVLIKFFDFLLDYFWFRCCV